MTREEAINIISQMIKDEEGFLSDNTVEAHKMAIKALEQEPSTKNDLGVDCISRAQTQTEIEMNASRYTIAKERGGMGQVEWSDQLIKVSDAVDIIRHLPSVTPQEPKTGHWIEKGKTDIAYDMCGYKSWATKYMCNHCGFIHTAIENHGVYSYCPNCGADMREVEV